MNEISGVIASKVPLIGGNNFKSRPEKPSNTNEAESFRKFLEKNLESNTPKTESAETLKFSSHAQKRLHSRDIQLSPDEFVKMQAAVQRARDKGSKDSLILTDSAAFVVSVKNNTVVTAVDKASLKDNVFTNIDTTIMI